MVTTTTRYVLDHLASRIDAICASVQATGHTYHRNDIADCLLENVPYDWRKILPKIKVSLVSSAIGPKARHQRLSTNLEESNRFSVYFANGSSNEYARRQASIAKAEKTGLVFDDVMKALKEWPAMARLSHKEQVLLHGEPYEQLVQELTIEAQQHISWDCSIPMAVWRVRVSALFLKSRDQISKAPRERVPLVRVEVLDEVLACVDQPNDLDDALINAVYSIANEACGSVAFAVHYQLEDMGMLSDAAPVRTPIELQVAFPPHKDRLATAFLITMKLDEYGELTDWSDNGVDLVRVEALTGLDEQPVLKPKSEKPTTSPAPDSPGDTFLLLDMQLSSVYLSKDSYVFRSYLSDGPIEFKKQTGISPKAMLKMADVPLKKIHGLEEYDEVMSILGDCAAGYRLDVDDLRTAMQLAEGGVYLKPLRLHVLMDLAAGVQEADLADDQSTLMSFLDKATSVQGKLLGKKPKTLKVSRKLLKEVPEIGQWAKTNGVEVVHPISGTDAGATHARMWNMAAEKLVNMRDREPWWKPLPKMTRTQFRNDIKRACSIFSGDTQNVDADYLRRFEIFMPMSMFTREQPATSPETASALLRGPA